MRTGGAIRIVTAFDAAKIDVVNRAGGRTSRTYLTQGHSEPVLAMRNAGF